MADYPPMWATNDFRRAIYDAFLRFASQKRRHEATLPEHSAQRQLFEAQYNWLVQRAHQLVKYLPDDRWNEISRRGESSRSHAKKRLAVEVLARLGTAGKAVRQGGEVPSIRDILLFAVTTALEAPASTYSQDPSLALAPPAPNNQLLPIPDAPGTFEQIRQQIKAIEHCSVEGINHRERLYAYAEHLSCGAYLSRVRESQLSISRNVAEVYNNLAHVPGYTAPDWTTLLNGHVAADYGTIDAASQQAQHTAPGVTAGRDEPPVPRPQVPIDLLLTDPTGPYTYEEVRQFLSSIKTFKGPHNSASLEIGRYILHLLPSEVAWNRWNYGQRWLISRNLTRISLPPHHHSQGFPPPPPPPAPNHSPEHLRPAVLPAVLPLLNTSQRYIPTAPLPLQHHMLPVAPPQQPLGSPFQRRQFPPRPTSDDSSPLVAPAELPHQYRMSFAAPPPDAFPPLSSTIDHPHEQQYHHYRSLAQGHRRIGLRTAARLGTTCEAFAAGRAFQ
ncbi:hypothetical protein JCM11641_001724 [Rhodosporidiobolus odoratus]